MGKWGFADKILCISAVCFVVAVWHNRGRVDVYDLTWRTVQDDGGDVYMKCRYFIDGCTKLPMRIEKYSKGDFNDVYTLQEVLVIKYSSDERVRREGDEH